MEVPLGIRVNGESGSPLGIRGKWEEQERARRFATVPLQFLGKSPESRLVFVAEESCI